MTQGRKLSSTDKFNFLRVLIRQPQRLTALHENKITMVRTQRNAAPSAQTLTTRIAHHIISAAHIGHQVHRIILGKESTDSSRRDRHRITVCFTIDYVESELSRFDRLFGGGSKRRRGF